MKSKKQNKLTDRTKQKQIHRYREHEQELARGEEHGDEGNGGGKLRSTNFIISHERDTYIQNREYSQYIVNSNVISFYSEQVAIRLIMVILL